MKRIWLFLIILLAFSWGIVGCSSSVAPRELSTVKQSSESFTVGKLNEVAPPTLIQQLEPALAQYQPQVSIISPKAEEILKDTTVEVKLQVQDLPIFKDPDLDMGPHLSFILDNEPPQAIYDLDKSLVLENLAPGTHTIRVFASRPWHESFKNDGAYAQTTFHLFTKTDDNHPDSNLPLLTYSRPNGDYGAEPILLDFYLTNAPLHLIAQENDDISDWRIRVTINGESFLLDNWQPIYLKGFEKGRNWVQLEFIDEDGKTISNIYNNTVRLISYTPNGQDTLSKLVRGELTLEQARGIIDPDYKAQSLPVAAPTSEPSSTEEIKPILEPETLPENIAPEEEKTLPLSPSTSEEKTLTPEKNNLPEVISPTTETSTTDQPEDIAPIPEETVTLEEEISPEIPTQDNFSSEQESAIIEEETSDLNPSEFQEIIPKIEEAPSTISQPYPEEQSSETALEETIEELEPLNSNHSSTQKTTASNPPTKFNWVDKILDRFKRLNTNS